MKYSVNADSPADGSYTVYHSPYHENTDKIKKNYTFLRAVKKKNKKSHKLKMIFDCHLAAIMIEFLQTGSMTA